MASGVPRKAAAQGERERSSLHTSFLAHANFLWLKVALGVALVSVVSYLLIDITPRHNGGSWYGYTLGTIGLVLIVWLAMLGIRKRAMTRGAWSLKAWTSAHVYLGLSLAVVGTLHSGFQLGWNVHTLAWTLMLLVILSGIWGITAYATLPAALSNNRDERTQAQMLEDIRAVDRLLHDAAQPLTPEQAVVVRATLDHDPFAGSMVQRLTGRYSNCPTAAALAQIRMSTGAHPDSGIDPLEKVDTLLSRKISALGRLRRHLKIKALLEVWLYIHVPLTFALIAALGAHILSVFFYW